VQNFARAAFGCPVIQGYGQTESTGGLTIQFAKDAATGEVGGPLRNVFLKFISEPECGYLTTD
jgi:long-chain acyl-CoA synthetase